VTDRSLLESPPTRARSLKGRPLGMGNSLMLPELSRLSLLEPGSRFVTALGERRRPMTGLNELREQGRITWIEEEHGWIAAPEEVMKALSNDGFEECKREMTTNRRDWQPPGGMWQGVDPRTRSVASAIWVNRPLWQQTIMAHGIKPSCSLLSMGSLSEVPRAMMTCRAEEVRRARRPKWSPSRPLTHVGCHARRAMRRRSCLKRLRINWLSADWRIKYRACRMRRPPVLKSRCWRLARSSITFASFGVTRSDAKVDL